MSIAALVKHFLEVCNTDPLKHPTNWTPLTDPRNTLGNLGDYVEVPLIGCLGESGQGVLRSCLAINLSGFPKQALKVQVPNNHILTQNLYYNYYYPKPKYLIIGYMDPLGRFRV